jgi:hypothetical protein
MTGITSGGGVMSIQELPSSASPFVVPNDVAAYCRQRGITDDLHKALSIVREFFPDLRKPELVLEEHEVLDHVVTIAGEARRAPADLAQRIWDCIGRWTDVVPRGALHYSRLRIHPEGE